MRFFYFKKSEYKMTWIEANHYCKGKNSTMLQHKIDNVTSDYWRGEYTRLSDWIHTIGEKTCFFKE